MKKFLIAVLCFMSLHIQAQEYPRKEINIEDFVQNLIGSPENTNIEDLYESFLQYYLHPLDLNTAGREELSALYILSEKQLNSFWDYRNKIGTLISIYELQSVPDFDLPLIYKLLPFVIVRPKESVLPDFSRNQQSLLLRYSQIPEKKKGFTDPDLRSKVRYEGPAFKSYLRYKMADSRNFSMGFTLEKDEGETSLTDFASAHFQLQNKGHLKNLVIGDYQVQFGQGLITSAGFYLGKGSETVLAIRKSHLGIKTYTSATEMNFFRGIASTFRFGNLEVTGFYSGNKRDANLSSDSILSRESYISSLQTSGLHRTVAEIEDKRRLFEQNFGMNICFKRHEEGFIFGLTALKTSFEIPIQQSDKLYKLFEFSGKDNFLIGLHYSYQLQNFNFFGEIARSSGGGWGLVNGVIGSLGRNTDFSMLFRNYQKDFHSFYADSFSENTRNINETGFYAGFKQQFSRKFSASAYVDFFRFPWYKYLVDKETTNGFGYLCKVLYRPRKSLEAYLQFKEENKEGNTKIQESYTDKKGNLNSREITVVRNNTRRVMSGSLTGKISNIWSFQSRISLGTSQFEGQGLSRGFALAQDLNADLNKWNFSGRVAFFNTDDYDSRQYFYEQDVLYAFSFPAYSGKGIRHSVIIRRKLSKRIDCWLRWSRTDLFDGMTFGSGLEEISVSHRSELKMQLRFHW